MDTMRGNFGSFAESEHYDHGEEDPVHESPPAPIGQDERRMQVRAYNHWASLLEDRNLPSIEDLDPENLPDFGPYSVLLDFSSGVDDPGIAYLGDELATECDVGESEINTLADVPSRSLLSRITDHYLQIIANQAPIGFEAEFVNQRGVTIAYRGILLPYSSDDDTIDFIYGVINWKELANAQASDELLLEIDQALQPKRATVPGFEVDGPLTDWADGPGAVPANDVAASRDEADADPDDYAPADFGVDDEGVLPEEDDLPVPSFGLADDDGGDDDEAEQLPARGPQFGSLLKMPLQLSPKPLATLDYVDGFDAHAPVLPAAYEPAVPHAYEPEPAMPVAYKSEPVEIDPSDMELGDWLAAARAMAVAARGSEERTRDSLYEAIGRAYDFSLAAAAQPAEFGNLLADAGLTVQDRAPMTPVVKLVFGPEYDKTRLTEYAAALTHAHRLELPRGALGDYLSKAEGGLKGVIKAERRLRKEMAGKTVDPRDAPGHALARKLRTLPAQRFEAIAAEGSEFALVLIRRSDEGEVVMLGEVPEDLALLERAARRLID